MNLEPIDPETALDLYLADRENDVTQATLYSHSSRIGHLVRWCQEKEITNLNELTGRLLHEYRLWRREEGDLSPASEKTQMDTIRVFVRWLESIDGVEPDLHTKVRSPTLSGDDNVRDIMIEEDRAEDVLGYLRKYEYASRPHVALSLLWHTMMRVGAVRALDLSDYDANEQCLEVVHRPETGTPIKNAEEGQRFIALSTDICELLDDWISDQRPSVVDEHGRKLLLPTPNGRAHTTTIRGDCYRYTRPCVSTNECPHGRDIQECPALAYDQAFECPSSLSPHAFRRGGITYALNQDWPMIAVSDRANVSEGVLDKHYDRRNHQEKMEQRRQYLDNL
ncbi:tyrosine-type recombinase/integrase [Natrinema versiforme]|uniref:Integrase domain-containing protein SAM domain-containing protein n=1 Tax=Natrinema versiforme JCM 10478 TaxID=1227496 RepID=L9Y7C8_9EURY|nr:site-specific integrase [Natrinema versiforme]ELY69959.1 integrase domain-containing protein SAM domain-containing protein [Natrinema versiforme JCM 10478]